MGDRAAIDRRYRERHPDRVQSASERYRSEHRAEINARKREAYALVYAEKRSLDLCECTVCGKRVRKCYIQMHHARMHSDSAAETFKRYCVLCDKAVDRSYLARHLAAHVAQQI